MDRRHFIKSSVLSSIALSSPGLFVQSCKQENTNKLGIALVGLGHYSTSQLAPALQQTKYCKLSAIVSGTEAKRNDWANQYQLEDSSIYTYEDFDRIAENPNVDIVYVVLPNAMHKEFVIRAAEAGKHVICEKPMGISSAECVEMITACKRNNVKLSVGYRLHFDNYHKYAMEIHKSSAIRNIEAEFGYVITDPNEWRMKKSLAGGGALMNIGIYCIQSACYISGQTPTMVSAQAFNNNPEFFSEVEETLSFQLFFDEEVANSFTTSHNMRANRLYVDADDEIFEISPAFYYNKIGANYASRSFTEVNQQALQMDDFSLCILRNETSRVSGEMGLRDLRIIEAIYESADSGRKVAIQNMLAEL